MNVTLEHEFDWHKTFFNVAQNGHGTHGANHNDGKILPRKKVSKTSKFLSYTKIGFFSRNIFGAKIQIFTECKKGNFFSNIVCHKKKNEVQKSNRKEFVCTEEAGQFSNLVFASRKTRYSSRNTQATPHFSSKINRVTQYTMCHCV